MNIHATCVAFEGRGLLILGGSGTGKSALALAMMACGAGLVSDDRTDLTEQGGRIFADAPAAIRGRIEARGVGILAATPVGPAEIVAVLDLGRTETDRLPPERTYDVMGISLPLVLGPYSFHLAPTMVQYLKQGRIC